MKVIKPSDVKIEEENRPVFIGKVTRQALIDANLSKNFNAAIVHFTAGAKSMLNTHTNDQILIVTDGKGIIATEQQEFTVGTGDVIFIPAGEKHWHRGAKDSSFSHISIQTKESQTLWES